MHQAVTDCGMRESQDRRMSQRLTRPLPLSSLLRVQHQAGRAPEGIHLLAPFRRTTSVNKDSKWFQYSTVSLLNIISRLSFWGRLEHRSVCRHRQLPLGLLAYKCFMAEYKQFSNTEIVEQVEFTGKHSLSCTLWILSRFLVNIY